MVVAWCSGIPQHQGQWQPCETLKYPRSVKDATDNRNVVSEPRISQIAQYTKYLVDICCAYDQMAKIYRFLFRGSILSLERQTEVKAV